MCLPHIQGGGRTSKTTIICGSKSVTKGMTPQLPVPNPKDTRLLYWKSSVYFDFRFIPGGAQMGLSG
nr:unnamed protein product [Callosobruchus analis]